MKEWFELTLKSGQYSPDEIDEALLTAGAIAVTYSDAEDHPVLEPLPGETPLWPETLVTGLFETPCDEKEIFSCVASVLSTEINALPVVKENHLQNTDWERSWMDHYHAMKFGENLWICPTHLSPPEPECATVMLDPGLAFGTGTHPSTALCLTWLSNHKAQVANHTTIDYGCGSGVLGIAARVLDAASCDATDIDPQAIKATHENAERNNVTIDCVLSNEFVAEPVDLVMANILALPLTALAGKLASLAKPNANIILAGILISDIDMIKEAYSPWFDFVEPFNTIDGWALVHGIKRA